MSLITFGVVLIAVGLGLSLNNHYIPMAVGIKTILAVAVGVFVCAWILLETGLTNGLATYQLGR